MTEIPTSNMQLVKNTELRKRAFKEYYFKYSKYIETPARIKQREFGMHFELRGMVRHLPFNTRGELLAAIIRDVPLDVYCSNAYYRFPAAPIHEKIFLGAYLIFDIDAKDLNLACVPSHSYLVCTRCGKAYPPTKSEASCTACGNNKFDRASIPCKNCIDSAKDQVRRLISMLKNDFGIQDKRILIYFSGNNGFHIHVNDNSFLALDSSCRMEIADYISGNGLMAESVGVRKDGNVSREGFRIKIPNSGVWSGWRYKTINKLGLKDDDPSNTHFYSIVKKKGGYNGFRDAIKNITEELGAKIDRQVSADIHRIFRMPGTLNSKSGLCKIRCRDLDSFKLADACFLSEEYIKVHMKTQVELKLKGRSKHITKELEELPTYEAVYLISKGLAEAT
jgi:DNA primase small subunit